ncbi:lytic transglycosylase domain-containing protein [Burkholderia multivorans]|uniref:lytic transglycosylase domain-containing protein n=1 Tax=Burkholderia multivorans TaxID=87883 RepID=UPI000B5A6B1D|nr:transglycosylase SLT domain-containing protein [Burkholderia multivorans]
MTPIIRASAQKYNLDPALVHAVVQQESSGNPSAWNKTGGGQGAAGLMQVRAPALSDYNAANGTKYTMQDLLKPEVGAEVGSWYLGQQLDRFNDPRKALAAYKDGAGSQAAQTGNSPYAQQVLGRLKMPQQKSQVLPGIPVGQQSGGMSDDAIFSAFSGGASSSSAQPQSGPTDEQIFAAFTGNAKQPVPVPAKPTPKMAQEPGVLESVGASLGKGFGSTVLGAQQLLGQGAKAIGLDNVGSWLVNDANQGLKNLQSQIAPYAAAHPVATTAGEIGGSIGATLPLGALGAGAGTLGGAARSGALVGGLGALASPVDPNSQNFWSDKAQQTALGAATGGLLGGASYGVGRALSPNISPDVQMLMDRGVTPTPGQILGGGFARTEAKLTSVPVLGDMIKNAQQRSVNQFNAAAYNQALAPIGEKFSGKVGQEGIEQVGNKIGAVYDKVLPQMQMRVDPQFQTDVINLGQMAQGLPDAQQNTFMKVLRTQIFDKLGPQGNMDGQTLKGVQSELARTAKGYLGDASFDNRQLGAAVSALRDAVDSNLTRVNPPELSKQLANANEAWANYARLRAAASSLGAANNEGIFTAAQLQNAVKAGDKSVGKGQFATGNALMQDLSSAGQKVLGSKYPDSGTAGRGLMALMAPGGIAAGLTTAPIPTVATLGGIGLGSLPYTTAGQRAAAALLTSRPQFAKTVGNAVAKFGPAVVPGGLPALLSGNR